MKPVSSPFRNEYNQRWTRSLFYEQWCLLPLDLKKKDPIYTLHGKREGLIDFGRAYIEAGDPTGYQVSQRLLENFEHFNLLMRSEWFREAKSTWDAELEAKLASEGLAAIKMFADGIEGVAPSVQLQAARYLADKAWKGTKAPTRGRPTKEEIKGELKREAADVADIASDLERIRAVK